MEPMKSFRHSPLFGLTVVAIYCIIAKWLLM